MDGWMLLDVMLPGACTLVSGNAATFLFLLILPRPGIHTSREMQSVYFFLTSLFFPFFF
jgi:hypothetical protein